MCGFGTLLKVYGHQAEVGGRIRPVTRVDARGRGPRRGSHSKLARASLVSQYFSVFKWLKHGLNQIRHLETPMFQFRVTTLI